MKFKLTIVTKKPDAECIESKGYTKFIENNPDILNEIVKLLQDRRGGISLNELTADLKKNCKHGGINRIYLHTLLKIWEKNWCTYFELGRVTYNTSDNKWYYLPKSHPDSKKHFIKPKSYM